VPVLGLLVSASAWGLWMRSTGQLPPEVKKFEATVSNGIADIKLPTPTASAPKTPAPPAKATAPAAPPKPQDDTSVFNFDGNGAKSVPSAPAAQQPRAVVEAPPADAAAAKANLEAARLAAAKRLGVDYTTAKSNAEHAWADLQTARSTDAPGSPELQAADQKWLDAKALLEAMQRRLRNDPAVAAAEKAH